MRRLLCVIALMASACGHKTSRRDAGAPDMAAPDAGAPDAGSMDAGSITPVARGQIPSALAITPDTAVWGSQDGESVLSAPLSGAGPVTELFAGSESQNVLAITTSGNEVYWGADDGSIHSVALDGTPGVTVTGFTMPRSLAVVNGTLYVADEGANCIWSLPLPLTGAMPAVLSPHLLGAELLASDGTSLVLATWGSDTNPAATSLRHDGMVGRVSLPDGAVTPLQVNQGQPAGLAIENGNVYWTSFDDNTITSMSMAGGSSSVLAMNLSAPAALAADSQRLYWVEDGLTADQIGGVYSMPLAGGPISTIAAERVDPIAISLDATRVYWAEVADPNVREGGIWSAPK